MTAQAETGAKAKELYIAGFILFKDAQELTQLFQLAEATDNGARVIYRISNQTAETLGIKQVRFDDSIEAVEQDTTQQWAVRFKLVEYRSVPQKKEQRLPEKQAAQQGGSNGGGESTASTDNVPPGTETDLAGFGTVLMQTEERLS